MANNEVKKEVVIAPPGGPRTAKGWCRGLKPAALFFFSAIRGNDPAAIRVVLDASVNAKAKSANPQPVF